MNTITGVAPTIPGYRLERLTKMLDHMRRLFISTDAPHHVFVSDYDQWLAAAVDLIARGAA